MVITLSAGDFLCPKIFPFINSSKKPSEIYLFFTELARFLICLQNRSIVSLFWYNMIYLCTFV